MLYFLKGMSRSPIAFVNYISRRSFCHGNECTTYCNNVQLTKLHCVHHKMFTSLFGPFSTVFSSKYVCVIICFGRDRKWVWSFYETVGRQQNQFEIYRNELLSLHPSIVNYKILTKVVIYSPKKKTSKPSQNQIATQYPHHSIYVSSEEPVAPPANRGTP